MPSSLPPLVLLALLLAAFGIGVGVAYLLIRRERRALAFEVRSLWERLDAIFYRSPLAISLCELDLRNAGLRVLDCNEEAAVLHGGSRDEVISAGVRMKSDSKETIEQVQTWFKSPRPAELWRGETKMRTLKWPGSSDLLCLGAGRNRRSRTHSVGGTRYLRTAKSRNGVEGKRAAVPPC